ncbi:MAG: RHS repeat-associated core domain-containing protein, partial [Lachnospiraceae bacterium]|nr:RHS repeat-associated core domain-containing protein [Lachnospiraceae bacterium]
MVSQEDIIDDKTSYNYYTYHYNHLGSTTAITDEAGNVVERFTYGTYGELLSGTTDNIHYLYNGQYGVSTEDNSLYYMRQRYYNPEIKRFINQDIVTGSIGNSQSLNRYCYVQGNPVSMTDPFGLFPLAFNGRELLHAFLNVAGMAPGLLGTVADITNAALYAMEGDVASAISCGISALPAVGNIIAGGMLVVRGGKALKTANYVRNICGLIGNGATFLRSGAAAISGAVDVVQHYIETGD